jgi:hypothetical protein
MFSEQYEFYIFRHILFYTISSIYMAMLGQYEKVRIRTPLKSLKK